jgi:hypothetical protein
MEDEEDDDEDEEETKPREKVKVTMMCYITSILPNNLRWWDWTPWRQTRGRKKKTRS